MEKFFNTCLIFGYETPNPNFWLNVFIFELILVAVLGCAAMALINVIILRLIRVRAKTMTKKTIQLHMMLYKALTTQMVVGALLLVIPTGIASISIYLESKYMNPVIIICVMFASSHAMVENLGVIYFVRHYRKFFIGLVKRIFSFVLKYTLPNQGTNPVIIINSTDESKTMTKNLQVVPPRRYSRAISVHNF
uniref:Uncharacterized protein n=1 Tax=Acrobeloides nanus TaxID=290746 RepID=A0A914DZK3_9BILA